MRKKSLAPFTFFMYEQPSSTNGAPSSNEVFHSGFDEEFRKRNAFQAALMGYWLAANPDQDEVAWVALFAEPFAGFYACLGDDLPHDAAKDQEAVKRWMEMLEGS